MERYFSVYLDHLHQYGGDISESSGDGLMVLFQDPDPNKHARQAIEAEATLRSSTSREVKRESSVQIESRSRSPRCQRLREFRGELWRPIIDLRSIP